jgi:hypothetical protein
MKRKEERNNVVLVGKPEFGRKIKMSKGKNVEREKCRKGKMSKKKWGKCRK